MQIKIAYGLGIENGLTVVPIVASKVLLCICYD